MLTKKRSKLKPCCFLAATVVISSTGEAGRQHGESLGQYNYDDEKGYYRQANTEMKGELSWPKYLCPDKDDTWSIVTHPGETLGLLNNPTPSKTVPTRGWRFLDIEMEVIRDDPTLTVTPGPLTLPRQFTVTASGEAALLWSKCLGVFTRTNRWILGWPMYVNTQGRSMYHDFTDWWVIGSSSLNSTELEGSGAHHSPTSVWTWRYWTGSELRPASVNVTGLN